MHAENKRMNNILSIHFLGKKSLLSIPQKTIFTLLALISWISSSIFRRNSRFASNISCTASSRSAEESWAFRRYVKNKNHIGIRIKFLNDSYYPLTSRSLSIRISSPSFCFSSCVSSSNSFVLLIWGFTLYSFFSFLFISFLRVNRNIACKKKIYTIWTYDTDKIVNVTQTSNKFKTVKN